MLPNLEQIELEISKRKEKYKRYRMDNLYKIADKFGKEITFKMNVEQEEIYSSTWNDDGIMVNSPKVLKSRQIGVTTLFVIAYLDDAINIPNINVYIQSHKDDSIEKIFRIARFAYDKLPENKKPRLDKGGGSKYEMYFPDINSRIYVGLENRSSAVHRVHFSEKAFQDKSKVSATLGALPVWQKYSEETTPNGMNWFRDDWVEYPERAKFFFPWFTHKLNRAPVENPENYILTDDEIELVERYKLDLEQIEFRRIKIASFPGKDIRLFLQEYPEDEQSCFMLSGNPVVSLDAIKRLRMSSIKPIREINGIKIFREFDKTMKYVCGADVAEGFATDYSCGKIFDIKRRECASFRAKIKPSDFAHKLDEMCKLFYRAGALPPLLAVERNNHGHAVLLELGDEHLNYANLFFFKEDRPGWLTDRVTRPVMIDTLLDGIENETIDIYDIDTINECLTLVDNGGKIEAATGQNDDCIIATAIAIQMLSEVARQTAFEDPSKYILL